MTILYTMLAVYIIGGLIVMGIFIQWSKTQEPQPGKLGLMISLVIVFFTWPGLLVAVAKHAWRGIRGGS